jgi:hypothetical protein
VDAIGLDLNDHFPQGTDAIENWLILRNCLAGNKIIDGN